MSVELFHADNSDFFDVLSLRCCAADAVRGSSLISCAEQGDRSAAIALKVGFWPFVREFEFAIDQQHLSRQVLVAGFGEPRVRRVFTGIARAVREMKQEEGSHSAHWMRDAQCLGVSDFGGPCVAGVQALIDRAHMKDLAGFFGTLAGTELIAEELSRYLVESRRFTDLFSRRRWMWGEVHLLADDGPSHLDIDLDLARAYGPTASGVEIGQGVLDTIALFARAADDVVAALLPELV